MTHKKPSIFRDTKRSLGDVIGIIPHRSEPGACCYHNALLICQPGCGSTWCFPSQTNPKKNSLRRRIWMRDDEGCHPTGCCIRFFLQELVLQRNVNETPMAATFNWTTTYSRIMSDMYGYVRWIAVLFLKAPVIFVDVGCGSGLEIMWEFLVSQILQVKRILARSTKGCEEGGFC